MLSRAQCDFLRVGIGVCRPMGLDGLDEVLVEVGHAGIVAGRCSSKPVGEILPDRAETMRSQSGGNLFGRFPVIGVHEDANVLVPAHTRQSEHVNLPGQQRQGRGPSVVKRQVVDQ